MTRFAKVFLAALVATASTALGAIPATATTSKPHHMRAQPGDGLIHVKSVYSVDETVTRLKADIASKGIKFFDEIDQQKLAAGAGITINPSVLILFGNPPLGIQFLTANPDSGIDWPVRMLVRQDAGGEVWIVYTDFKYIAQRHHITNRDQQFAMATMVAGSIASAAQAK